MNLLVTGGASGLGKPIVLKLAQKKSNEIYFTYNKSGLDAQEIQKKYSNVHGIKCDFSKALDLKSLLHKMQKMDLDILVNNAIATVDLKSFHKQNQKNILASFKNNILSTVNITQEAIKIFRLKNSGKVITILTSYLDSPPLGLAFYVAEKAYLQSLCKSLARENRKFYIQTICIYPQPMDTKLQNIVDPRFAKNKYLRKTSEVAKKIVYIIENHRNKMMTNIKV